MNIRFPLVAAALASLMLLSQPGRADEGKRFPLNASYLEECGGCHVAYPPRLLSLPAWQAIMSGLDRHFGSDASLEPAKAREIGDFLATHAGRRAQPGAAGAAPRITETAWFRHEHRDGHDGITAAVWKSPAVKSPANCGACHPKAAEGDYREDDIRIPRTR